MPFNDATIINAVAAQERSIAGVKQSFDFAKNPNALNQLPAVIHFPGSFTSKPRAHHNVWENVINVTSVVFIAPRQVQGGNLAYLENEAMPYGDKWRSKFQTESVVSDLLAATGSIKCFITGGVYSVGPPLLFFAGIEYIGWVMSFQFANA